MRSYPGNQARNKEAKNIYNDRLSRARTPSENAFGVWTQRYRVFQRRIQMSPEHLDKVVLATCSLYNYLRDDADPVATEVDSTNSPPTYALIDLRHIGGNTTDDVMAVRDSVGDLLVSPQGAVDWQLEMIRKRLIFCKMFTNKCFVNRTSQTVTKCLNLFKLLLYISCFFPN
jgi:hypothetical protein